MSDACIFALPRKPGLPWPVVPALARGPALQILAAVCQHRELRALAVLPSRPVVLVRNGRDFKITGNQSTVRAGTEIKVKTERPSESSQPDVKWIPAHG